MIETLLEPSIISCLHTNYGIEVVILTLLPLGADENASVYKAQTQDHTCYFIKLKHGEHDDVNIMILELLEKAQIHEVIIPIKTKNGKLIEKINDFSLIVYPFIEGENGFNCDLTQTQWIALGEVLRRVHAVNIPLSIQGRLRYEKYGSKWRDVVRSFYPHIDSEGKGDEIALRLLAFMKANRIIICQLVDRAQALADMLVHESFKFVLCHSDIHAGNILLGKNNTFYIVDWDEPMMAPKERDLMFIGAGVCNVWNKSDEEQFFYRGYGKVEINKMLLSYYRCERIVEDIAQFIQALLLTATGGDNRLEMYKHFMAMFEPRGVVDIALNTTP